MALGSPTGIIGDGIIIMGVIPPAPAAPSSWDWLIELGRWGLSVCVPTFAQLTLRDAGAEPGAGPGLGEPMRAAWGREMWLMFRCCRCGCCFGSVVMGLPDRRLDESSGDLAGSEGPVVGSSDLCAYISTLYSIVVSDVSCGWEEADNHLQPALLQQRMIPKLLSPIRDVGLDHRVTPGTGQVEVLAQPLLLDRKLVTALLDRVFRQLAHVN